MSEETVQTVVIAHLVCIGDEPASIEAPADLVRLEQDGAAPSDKL